jgi:MFS family permease
MEVPPALRPVHHRSVVENLREGVHYAFGFAPIRAIILLVAVISLVGMPYTVLMPIVADKVLGDGGSESGAYVYGLLMTASGVGALAGAIYMASRQTVLGLGRKIVLACTLFSAGIMVFSASSLLWLSLLTLMVSGFGMMVMMASCNTILQTIVEDDKRGRVMSLYTMAFMGLAPLGSLIGGKVASLLGTPAALLLCGAGCLGAGMVRDPAGGAATAGPADLSAARHSAGGRVGHSAGPGSVRERGCRSAGSRGRWGKELSHDRSL